jgi:hypothetical protein
VKIVRRVKVFASVSPRMSTTFTVADGRCWCAGPCSVRPVMYPSPLVEGWGEKSRRSARVGGVAGQKVLVSWSLRAAPSGYTVTCMRRWQVRIGGRSVTVCAAGRRDAVTVAVRELLRRDDATGWPYCQPVHVRPA